MACQQVSDHLLLISNISYKESENLFYQNASHFGQISIFNFIQKSGMCIVCYYDSRCARKALDGIRSKSPLVNIKFTWSRFFSIEKISSSLLIGYKNAGLINSNVVSKFFTSFGEIQSFIISDDQKFLKLIYYDTRSCIKVFNANLDDFVIIFIKPSDNPNNFTFSQHDLKFQNFENLYEAEKQKNTEVAAFNQNLLSKYQKLENENLILKKQIKEQLTTIQKDNQSIVKKVEYEHKYSNLKRTLKYRKSDDPRRSDRSERFDRSNRYRKNAGIEGIEPNIKGNFPDFRNDESILKELSELEKIQPNLRKYSEKIYNYAFSLYLYSAKCFKFIHQSFPFPCVSSLYHHFGEDMNRHKEYICDLKYTKFLIDSYKEIFKISDQFPVIISGDATVACSDPMFKSVPKFRHVYLYQLQVLFPNIPVLPAYLKLHSQSNFTIENLKEMIYLQNIIEDLNLECLAFSTDGDTGIDEYHKHTFNSYDQFTNEKNEVIAVPRPGHPILDLCHLLKTQHARFFRQNLSLSPNSPVISIELVQSLVNRGKCFTEINETIRFKDEYAFDFFSPLSFLDVVQKDQIIIFGYFLLPFVIWECAIRYRNLSNKQRIYFLNLAFLIFKFEYDDFHSKNIYLHFYEENVKNCNILSFWTKSSLIKYMNTLIVDIYSIKKYGNYYLIALNRLGNYTIEKTFGNTREYMNNSIDEELFKDVLIHQVLRKEVNEVLQLNNSQKSPNEKGGVIISSNDQEFFDFNSLEIEKEIKKLRNAAFSSEFVIHTNDLQSLNLLMTNLSKDPNAKDTIPDFESPTASKQIPMRWNIPINNH